MSSLFHRKKTSSNSKNEESQIELNEAAAASVIPEDPNRPCVLGFSEEEARAENYFLVIEIIDKIGEAVRGALYEMRDLPGCEFIEWGYSPRELHERKKMAEPIENWDVLLLAKVCSHYCKNIQSVISNLQRSHPVQFEKFRKSWDMDRNCNILRETRNELAHIATNKLNEKEFKMYYDRLKSVASFFGIPLEAIEKIRDEKIEINMADFRNFQNFMHQGEEAMNNKEFNKALRYYQMAVYVAGENEGVPSPCRIKALGKCSEAAALTSCKELSEAYKKCQIIAINKMNSDAKT